MIDLHAHTTASDGSLTPAELVARAHQQGVQALAITDHDTLAGLAAGQLAGQQWGVEIVPGLEISAEFPVGTMHILGYYIDTEDPTLANQLAGLRHARDTRNPQIIDKLQQLGCDITLAEVEAVAGGSVVGRPHFAQVMLKKGFVSTPQEAFDRYLAKGSPAYVEKARLMPQDAVAAIHQAGGVAVLAHPYQLRTTSLEALEKIVQELKGYGLDGLEVIYSRHTDQQTQDYRQLATRYDLLITGGSDFHGVTKPDIEVGRGLGNLAVPAALLDAVKTKASDNRNQYR